jgi:HAD superfamily hydrolase (TIGR01662 family)
MAAGRWVCLDVGETLIDETRIWGLWADVLGFTRLTFMAAFGAVLARGGEYSDVFEFLGRQDWRKHMPEVAAAYGGFQESDLYVDALPALESLRASGYSVSIFANQPAERTAELRALGVDADVVAMSDELGLHKPAPEFFARALEMMADPDPGQVAYVGDRLDNDIRPALDAGMRTVWLRRGPWAVISDEAPPAATLVVDSLTELVERIDDCWRHH